MSKAFTKDDADSLEVMVPARAPLPPGVDNYVTPRGLAALQTERRELDAERQRHASSAETPDRARALAIVHARLAELDARLACAQLIDPKSQPHDEVRFGATVTVRGAEKERRLQIVGVDEADIARGRVAFVAPLARALLGKRVGDAATVRTPRGDEELEVVAIDYEG